MWMMAISMQVGGKAGSKFYRLLVKRAQGAGRGKPLISLGSHTGQKSPMEEIEIQFGCAPSPIWLRADSGLRVSLPLRRVMVGSVSGFALPVPPRNSPVRVRLINGHVTGGRFAPNQKSFAGGSTRA